MRGWDECNGVDVLVFFFQAEDGIRDRLVTGVQTCALPISKSFYSRDLLDTKKIINDTIAYIESRNIWGRYGF